MKGVPMSSRGHVLLLAVTSFLVGTSEYIIAGILDLIAAGLQTSIASVGLLITLFSLVYAVGAPVLMVVFARLDRKKLLLLALTVFVASNVVAFVAPTYAVFFGARVVMALSAGVVIVTALNIAVKLAPTHQRAGALATVATGFTASLILGVPAGRVIAESLGWQAVFLAVAAAGVVAVVLLWVLLPSAEGDEPVPLATQLALLRDPAVLRGLLISFFWLTGYSITYTYLTPYLLDVAGVVGSAVTWVLLVFGVASLVGSKLGGFATDRWGVGRPLLVGLGLHVLALVALALVAGPALAPLVTVLVVWSLAAWTTGPTQQYHLATIRPRSSGVLLGLNQSVMQLAIAAGAGIGGIAVTSEAGLGSITWIGAVGVLVAIAISVVHVGLPALRVGRHPSSDRHPEPVREPRPMR
jgi:DHA1 family putative efflux transporter-like MFS transporter